MSETPTFILHEENGEWWAEWPLHRYYAVGQTREKVMQMCREGVEFITGRPAEESTIVWVYGKGNT